MTEPKKEAAVPRPATTVLLLRPSEPGDAASPLEVFMVVRHHQIDSFSGALVFPGGKLEDADGDPWLQDALRPARRRSATRSSSSASPAFARRSRNAAFFSPTSAARRR